MSNDTIPSEYICPITSELMKDPVCDREGNTYERSAIVKWLKSSSTSPITRNPLSADDLAPNRALRDTIENWAKQNGWTVPETQKKRQLQPPVAANAQSKAVDVLQETPASIQFVHEPQTGHCVLSVIPPSAPTNGCRAAMDVICVLDVSASMGIEATVQNSKGVSESHGLTILDVVKHASKTVAHMLGDNDRYSLVTFSNVAKTVLPLTTMDKAGKDLVTKTLKDIRQSGQTNLWDGLHTAMEMLKSTSTGRNASILILTDGCPNVEPPRGHIPSLRQYYDNLGGAPSFTVNTFGFGYSLDSKLLYDISVESNGMYVFIPDSGLVGTVFVNTVANLLGTMGTAVTASIECDGAKIGAKGASPIADSATLLTPTSYGGSCQLGTMQFGQTRDIYFQVAPKTNGCAAPKLFAKIEYLCGGKKVTVTEEAKQIDAGDRSIAQQCARADFLAATMMLMMSPKDLEPTRQFAKTWGAFKGSDKLIDAFLYDMQGEVTLAVSKTALFDKWGRHFLPSLVRANILQQCNNFKDHSVQCYGGSIFGQLRDEGEAIFTKIPPPEPTKTSPREKYDTPYGGIGACGRGGRRMSAARPQPQPAPVNMQAYYNCSGGCVAAHCKVLLKDNTTKDACDVAQGDVLRNGAVVQCAVKIRIPQGQMEVVEFQDGLLISPYHPIYQDGQWSFPIASQHAKSTTTMLKGEFLHNFVLNNTHMVNVNGIDLVTFGHGLTSNSVVSHSFFGSEKVINALSTLKGFNEGCVIVDSFLRHETTNEVVGLWGETLENGA